MAIINKTPFKRPLADSEDLQTNISVYCDLLCHNLTNGMIHKAFELLRQHHPYFRLHAENLDGQLWLIEEENGKIPLTMIEGITTQWEEELIDFANQSRDHTVSLTFFQCRYDTQGHYQLFGVVNHVTLDGLGFTTALHTFFSYLGEMSERTNYEDVLLADKRSFIDVLNRNPKSEAPIFSFIDNCLPPQELDSDESDTARPYTSSRKGKTIGIFKNFERNITNNLLACGKGRSITLQGMLSIAALITSIWIRKIRPQFPILAQNWCATNLRQSAQPPIDPNDCVAASAPLAWQQKIESDSHIWSLAQDATQQLHTHNDQHMGWDFLNAKKFGVFVQRPSVMTSSIGKTSIGTQYGRMQISDLRMMTALYDYVSSDTASHINLASIYAGRLNCVTGFTYPGLSKQWGERFHDGVIYILECFAKDSDLTVSSIIELLDERDRNLLLASTSRLTIKSRLDWIVPSNHRVQFGSLKVVAGLAIASCCMVYLSLRYASFFKRNLITFRMISSHYQRLLF